MSPAEQRANGVLDVPFLRRREFLLASSGAVGAVLFTGCVPAQREMTAESRVLMAEDVLSAYDDWYATTCRGCAAGCGVVVRVVDGRARKVDGNPDHPVNRGKLCARGQALVQEQYHPDRVRGPLRGKRRTDRVPIGWDEAITTVTGALRQAASQQRAGDVTLITPPLSGAEAILVSRFAQAYGLKWMAFDPISEAPLREASRRVFATEQLPRFDVQHARTVLSVGADWVTSWLSPVHYSMEYGMFRQGDYDARSFQPRPSERPRGRLIHVESHFSSTAAAADDWIWIRPGTEGLFALSLAYALGGEALDGFAPEQTAERTGVSAERVHTIARLLLEEQPSLVIAGGNAGAHTNGTEALSAILRLNVLLGNVGQPGGVLSTPAPPLPDLVSPGDGQPVADWQEFVERMRGGQTQAVLILGGANPVHGLPAALGFADALSRVPFVASFASFEDDTTAFADLVLPSHLPLEDWSADVPRPVTGAAILSAQQPVVQPLFDTRSAWDVLLTLADELGDATRQALPWPTFKDLVQEITGTLQNTQVGRGSVRATNRPDFWKELLQRGGWWDTGASAGVLNAPTSSNTGTALSDAQFDGDSATYPFVLVPFEHNTLASGGGAHLPWLQAAPDPVTSITWQTWVEVNPGVASQLGIAEGDIVGIESTRGRIEAMVYVSPAAPPEVLAMPLGQGHAGSGRWANGRGANAFAVLAPLVDSSTGALAYGATRVRIAKTGRNTPVSKFEGNSPARQLPGQEVLKIQHG